MGFTFSLLLWLIWYLPKNMKPLNILARIPGGITPLAFINPVFSMQVPAYAIRSTDRINKCTDTDVITSKKHIYYTHSCSSQVCSWTMGSSSRLRITLDSEGISLHKTCTWWYTIPSISQCATAISPAIFSSQGHRSRVTRKLCVVREGKAELFIHLSALMKMHQDLSKLGSYYQLCQYCSSESKIWITVHTQMP